MKILIISQYYWPEFFPINNISKKLKQNGHEITVVTGKPNYPGGKIFDGYKSSGVLSEVWEGIEVIRLPLRPRHKGVINLMLNYFSFVFSGIRYIPKLLNNKKFDIIFVYAPSPITQAIPAIWLKRKIKTHLMIWVQDLWPESLEATGYVKNKFLLNLVERLVRWIYKHTDTLLAQSKSFEGQLNNYADKDKIIYYPQSSESQKTNKDKIDLPGNISELFESGFNIVFTGNIGSAQSMPTLLNAIFDLKDTDCRFIFIGDGSLLEWAKSEAHVMGLLNVFFPGRMDNVFMPVIYQKSDALLISLTNKNIFSYTIPGKLQAYLSAGRPIIGSINGEAADIIRNSKAGVVFPAEESKLLSQGIRKFRALSQVERNNMGQSGMNYFNKNFNIDIMVNKLITIIKERTGVLQ